MEIEGGARVAELAESPAFDLADPFACDPEFVADV
jgi:hypothetical protein